MLLVSLALSLCLQEPPPRTVPPLSSVGDVSSFALEEVSLDQACARLSAATGLPVEARGEARRPISVDLERVGFWQAVLAVCEAGEVGLEPSSQGTVVLGAQWDLPAAEADGVVLVLARGGGVRGERSGTLDIALRLAPGFEVVGAAAPDFSGGTDHEK